MGHYVTFLLDLGAERPNRAIAETVRYAPDRQEFPKSAFHWKIVCDAKGTVSIRANVNGKAALIAASTWDDGVLGELRQREPNVPTGPQWGFVTAALEAELAKRAASGEPEDPSLVDPISDVEARYLKGADPSVLDTTFHHGDPPKQPPKQPGKGPGALALLGIAAVIAAVAMPIVCVIEGKAAKRATAPASTPAPIAVAPTPPTAPPPSPPPAPVPIEQQVAAAATFTDALALAKTDATGTLLAHFPKLRWADVDVPAETSIGHVQKDAEAERGKRMCGEGVIEKIERRDVDRRKVFVGRLRLADGDVIAFTALGTTGELIKRASAKFCGAVTGTHDDAVMLVGLFDLPENRGPIVEQ